MGATQRKFADDGWAIWINGDDTSTVYINDWINPLGASFIDFAIHIRGVKDSAGLNVYVPFPISAEDIYDVSLHFKNEKVLRATFNAGCIIDYKKNICTSEIAYNGRTVDIIHISCFEFQVEPLSDGSLLTIDLSKLNAYIANDEAYLIFRIPHKSLDDTFRKTANMGDAMDRFRTLITTPVESEKYGYSVRINEARLLPGEINKIGAFHRQKLKKAVITISIDESYKLTDSNCYRIHRLEESLYQEYAPESFPLENVITYQWNQNRTINLNGHFNFYFDITRETVSSGSVLIYLLLLLVIGIAGGALWDIIKAIFHLF